jgi:death-on-curing protein
LRSPKFINKEEVLNIHNDQIKKYGGSLGIRDDGLLESALYQPQATFGGEFLHPTIVEQAAAYLFHIANNHPFIDGNKRVAFEVTIAFLIINGYRLKMTPQTAYDLTLQVADGTIAKEELIEVLRNHISEFI